MPKIGDKGLFTKELEDSLENGGVDLVVHSLKDMPCQTLPDKLIISGVPEREDPTDALVMAKRWCGVKSSLAEFNDGATIGTSSLRRISQLKEKFPKLKFETIRGNLQTRFAKLDDEGNKFDAIILATAGLKRMGYEDRITQVSILIIIINHLRYPTNLGRITLLGKIGYNHIILLYFTKIYKFLL